MSVNKVIILGRLGQDPDLKYTPSGVAVCTFSIATSESYKDKKTSEKKEKVQWHRVVVWSNLAELCNQYLKKGRQAFIEGQLETRQWKDKNDVTHYATEIIAKSVQFLGDKKDSSPDKESDENLDFSADDIPF